MKGFKLTPFLLFVLLLLVLVFAMLFGSVTNKIIEGNTGSSSFTQADVGTYGSATLDVVYTDTSITIYYDKSNGNIVVPSSDDSQYTLITRGGESSSVTSDQYSSSGSVTDTDAAPSTYSVNGYTIMYIAYKYKTVIIVSQGTELKQLYKIAETSNNEEDTTGRVMGLSQPDPIPTEVTTVVPIAPVGPTFDNASITINGVASTTRLFKLQAQSGSLPGIFYNLDDGIIVGNVGENNVDGSTSTDYVGGTSVQVSGTGMVIGVLLGGQVIVSLIQNEESSGYKASNVYVVTYESAYEDETAEFQVEFGNTAAPDSSNGSSPDSNSGSGSDSGSDSNSGSNSGSGSSGTSCNTQYANPVTYTCPTGTEDDSMNQPCNNPNYILKSEIVPPVCPGCPPCPVVSPDNCTLSINSNGEIVDCTGKKYEPNDISGSPSSSWAGSLGGAVSDTAKAAGELGETGVRTTGRVGEKALDTVTGAVDATVGGVGNIVGELGDTVGDLAGGLGQGVAGLGQGVAGLGQGAADIVTGVSGDVTGLGNNLINSTTGLLEDAGSGVTGLATNEQIMRQQQQFIDAIQGRPGYGYGQAPGYGYGTQYGYGYPMQPVYGQPGYGQPMQGAYGQAMQPGYGYSYPQSCPRSSSNFMPITNDFSQFT
tara:strand:- start:768 stop:2717 length:1950 start_codon:yes stop_codon:yes gene_type:complete